MNAKQSWVDTHTDPVVLWTTGSKNSKTADVPTAYIGGTREESKATCKGCPLLESKQCYAHFGTPALAHSSMIRGKKQTLDVVDALAGRSVRAKMVRIGAIGDPGALSLSWHQRVAEKVRSAGLALVGYTHHWRRRPDLQPYLMASCDDLEGADVALEQGWRAAVVLPATHEGRTFETPNGRRGVVCPAQTSGGRVQCNDCRLCDASKAGPLIGFIDHGPRARAEQRKKVV